MHRAPTPDAVAGRVSVRAINFELEHALQAIASEKAARLLRYSPNIDQVCIELENDPTRDSANEYVAKGRIDFGGPAILASVTGAEAGPTLNYLIDQLEHQLRKQRRANAVPAAAAHARATR